MNQSKARQFTAVVLAGDRAPGDAVAQAAGVPCKALSVVGGTPMVLRVLDALNSSREVGDRILCGPPFEAIKTCKRLRAEVESGQIRWLKNEATPSSSAYCAMQSIPGTSSILLTTADHALLNSQIVDYFCERARSTGCDLVLALAPRELVAAAFPERKNTVLKLRDRRYCNCNLFAFMTPHARSAADWWRRVEAQRKKPLRVVGALGWVAVARYLLGRLTFDEGLARLSSSLGVSVGAVIMPFPEAAVDVDTVKDWDSVQAILEANRQTERDESNH